MTLADELEAATNNLVGDVGWDALEDAVGGDLRVFAQEQRAALRDADRLREALRACAKIMCIRVFWGADRPCPEYAGRDLCPTCLARAALSEPVPADSEAGR